MSAESPEQPLALLRRLKIGREEFCQRLLTCLILEAPYPKWNSRSAPSERGIQFLRALHGACFGSGWLDEAPEFVDEFELAPRHDSERGGAPDYAILWSDVVWIIELKTERASHRRDQIPSYFELAHHYFPGARVDITYLTPGAPYAFGAQPGWARYAHASWNDLALWVENTWDTHVPDPWPEYGRVLVNTIRALERTRPSEWRTAMLGSELDAQVAEPETVTNLFERGMQLAAMTADDGQQRAVESDATALDVLLELRLELRTAVASASAASPLRHVVPWLWRTESRGRALTRGGAEDGYELRLSRYQASQYV